MSPYFEKGYFCICHSITGLVIGRLFWKALNAIIMSVLVTGRQREAHAEKEVMRPEGRDWRHVVEPLEGAPPCHRLDLGSVKQIWDFRRPQLWQNARLLFCAALFVVTAYGSHRKLTQDTTRHQGTHRKNESN